MDKAKVFAGRIPRCGWCTQFFCRAVCRHLFVILSPIADVSSHAANLLDSDWWCSFSPPLLRMISIEIPFRLASSKRKSLLWAWKIWKTIVANLRNSAKALTTSLWALAAYGWRGQRDRTWECFNLLRRNMSWVCRACIAFWTLQWHANASRSLLQRLRDLLHIGQVGLHVCFFTCSFSS